MTSRQQRTHLKLARPQPAIDSSKPSPVFNKPGTRPNTVILFPGDYQDRDFSISSNLRSKSSTESAEDLQLLADQQKQAEEEEAKRKKWIENAKPKQWPTIIDQITGRSYGRGARKRAQARVWIQPGDGHVTVNNHRTFISYFPRLSDRDLILQPFVVTETCGKFDVAIQVKGGGLTGQAGAIRLGVARALNAYHPELYRAPLKFHGFLTRDARKVERKKVGKVKARKSPQWVRR